MRLPKDLPNLHGFEFRAYTKNLFSEEVRGLVLFDGQTFRTFSRDDCGFISPLGIKHLKGWDYLPEL